jgi:hypothetical protein
MSLKALSLGSAGSAADLIVISSTTNATPIVATFAANHGLKDGDRIAVAGVTGNTNANGEWTLAFTGATTAQLVGSAGNGTHGGTVRVAVMLDKTPHMAGHSALLDSFGNAVATVDIEAYGSYSDFASGYNTSGVSAPVVSISGVTNSAGSATTPAKSTLTAAATNAGFQGEVKLARYMRGVVTAYTSGTFNARVVA